MIEFLRLAAGVAADTATYLLAWWAVPAWALLGTVLLQRLARDWPLEGWSLSEGAPRRLVGAFLLAVARPPGRSDVRRHLERLDGRPGATAVYLAAGHGLTLYYFALLGPLLGKDVLLSHVSGMLAFAAFATAFLAVLPPSGAATRVDEPDRGSLGSGDSAGADGGRRGWGSLLLGEGGRFLGWSLWGLVVGGLVGAAGLSSPSVFLTELLPGEGLARQVVHAVVGLIAAPATLMGPVATLFAGTYLWKVGLAQAGLVAFFCAVTVSPQRVRLYRDVWGAGRTRRWVGALALAAVAAGLFVAVVFGLTGLEIHYKLAPEQLWRP